MESVREFSMRKNSIKEVAKLAGVSIATVSRCLNYPEKVTERTRERVNKAIAETGYVPNTLAQSFRRGRTNLVMIVLPSIGDPFFSRVVAGIRSIAREKGYSFVIEETQLNTMSADEIGAMLVSQQTDGLMLLASLSPFGTDILSSNNHRRLPIVVGCEIVSAELSHFPSVRIDNAAAAEEITDYVISNGHKRIAMIYGQESTLLTRDRELGYRKAMEKARLTIDDGWVLEGKLTIKGARAATRTLLAHKNRPTAIFCVNDEMAIGCIHEIKAAGLSVPDDISVVGFDDTRYAEVLDPPLTTIRQPAEEIGKRAMSRLCDEIEDGRSDNGTPEIVAHELVIRDSVKQIS